MILISGVSERNSERSQGSFSPIELSPPLTTIFSLHREPSLTSKQFIVSQIQTVSCCAVLKSLGGSCARHTASKLFQCPQIVIRSVLREEYLRTDVELFQTHFLLQL